MFPKQLVHTIQISVIMPLPWVGGATGAISLTENPEFHRRTKHIEVRYHWIREKIELNEIQVSQVSTKDMVADGLTKPLNLQLFKKFRVMMGMN